MADSYINEGSPNTNYGNDSLVHVDPVNGAFERVLVRFDVTSIPVGSTVESATLTMCMQNILSLAVGRTHELHRMSGSWSEAGVTWNNAPSFSGVEDTISVPLAIGCVDFDVSSDVEQWVSGSGQSNDGWLIMDESEGAGWADRRRVREQREWDNCATPALDDRLHALIHLPAAGCRPRMRSTAVGSTSSRRSTSSVVFS